MTNQKLLVTGGAGYIGAVLVPELLDEGHHVTVFDAFLYGTDPSSDPVVHERCAKIHGDIRDFAAVDAALEEGGFDSVIHLAAISNDPSSELDHRVTESVNLRAVDHLMRASKRFGVRRFLYASSASVYGIKDDENVTEELSLDPITIYAKCKAEGEKILKSLVDESFVGVSVRSATVCGYSPRLRLDLTINLLTDQALTDGRIRVFGGSQMRPNVHILDLTAFYRMLLTAPAEKITGSGVQREPGERIGHGLGRNDPRRARLVAADRHRADRRPAFLPPLRRSGAQGARLRAAARFGHCRPRAARSLRLGPGFGQPLQRLSKRSMDEGPPRALAIGREARFMTSVPYVDLVKQNQALRPRILEAIDRVLGHGQFINGPEVSELEEKLAQRLAVKEVVGVGLWHVRAHLGHAGSPHWPRGRSHHRLSFVRGYRYFGFAWSGRRRSSSTSIRRLG